MEHIIQLRVEKLPEGMYLATSDDIQGLVAQCRTIQETPEIARDVAKKLLEAQSEVAVAGSGDRAFGRNARGGALAQIQKNWRPPGRTDFFDPACAFARKPQHLGVPP